MPCRVGITTDPEERRAYWQNQVVGFKNWQILAETKTKERAQELETRYARRHNCQAHPGGPNLPGLWYVYYFEYTRER